MPFIPISSLSHCVVLQRSAASTFRGGGGAKACDVVGATEACSCIGGAIGERVCGDDMTFGRCGPCAEADATAAPFVGNCHRCGSRPIFLVCSEEVQRVTAAAPAFSETRSWTAERWHNVAPLVSVGSPTAA